MERLETMQRNVLGNGLSQCLLCGEVLGFLGSSSVFCKDCRKVSPALTCHAAPQHRSALPPVALHPSFRDSVCACIYVCADVVCLGEEEPEGWMVRLLELAQASRERPGCESSSSANHMTSEKWCSFSCLIFSIWKIEATMACTPESWDQIH